MASRKRDKETSETRRRPATTPEARENEMISISMDLAERQIRDGTASSQVVTHFLKLGSSREILEQKRLESENKLAQAKIEELESRVRVEELYGEAIKAMASYTGADPVSENDDEDSSI